MPIKYNFFLIVGILLIMYNDIYSQSENQVLTIETLRLSTGYLIIDQRANSEEFTFNNSKIFFNLSYKFLNFSIGDHYPKLGLTNELGIKNTLAFLKAGPQLLFNSNLFVDFHLGLGLIFFKSLILKPLSGTIFFGFTPMYNFDLNEKLKLEIEGGIESSIEEKFALSTYIMIGFGYKITK